jgi:hypothetical protein
MDMGWNIEGFDFVDFQFSPKEQRTAARLRAAIV